MSFLNRVQKGFGSAKFKADQLLRINQVKGEISSIRREITEVHRRIADTAMELHRNGTLSESELTQLCLSVDQFNADIAQKEAQIAAIRSELPSAEEPASSSVTPPSVASPAAYAGMQECINCHYLVPAESAFCPECGQTLGEAEVEPPVAPPATAAEPVCSQCGVQLPPEAVFCPGCGTAVGETAEEITEETSNLLSHDES